jgi:formate-dependent nitrite reductase membrane component NrfD
VLIADLEHPWRFPLIFTRPQARSWLVRGGLFITAYGVVLLAHFVGSVARLPGVQAAWIWPGVPLAVFTAIYTAYLFAESRGRDLWQNPLLPVQLLVQATLAGAAVLLAVSPWLEPGAGPLLGRVVAWASLAQIVLVASDVTLGHPTAHARLAAHEMTSGRFAWAFWAGLRLSAIGLAGGMAGPVVAPFVLAGLLAYEHAYVQGGQSVPLA